MAADLVTATPADQSGNTSSIRQTIRDDILPFLRAFRKMSPLPRQKTLPDWWRHIGPAAFDCDAWYPIATLQTRARALKPSVDNATDCPTAARHWCCRIHGPTDA